MLGVAREKPKHLCAGQVLERNEISWCGKGLSMSSRHCRGQSHSIPGFPSWAALHKPRILSLKDPVSSQPRRQTQGSPSTNPKLACLCVCRSPRDPFAEDL